MHISDMMSSYFTLDMKEHHSTVDILIKHKESQKESMLRTEHHEALAVFADNRINMILTELMLIKYVLKLMQAKHVFHQHKHQKVYCYHAVISVSDRKESITLHKLKQWERETDELIQLWIAGWGFNFLSVYIKIFGNMATAHTLISTAKKHLIRFS